MDGIRKRIAMVMIEKNFYQSKKWRHVRAVALRRDGYKDQLDLRLGERTEAETVHHIFPIEVYPEYRFKLWNLISVTRDNHELMHNRITGGLSQAGRRLMQEAAEKNGISVSELILVVGLAGSGKTTYVRQHMGNGIAYDLDAIAAAFRLRKEHEEYHKTARRMANSMCRAFAEQARSYGGKVYIIRTAPTVDEAVGYDPDAIVFCTGRHDITHRKDHAADGMKRQQAEQGQQAKRIAELLEYCKANELSFFEIT